MYKKCKTDNLNQPINLIPIIIKMFEKYSFSLNSSKLWLLSLLILIIKYEFNVQLLIKRPFISKINFWNGCHANKTHCEAKMQRSQTGKINVLLSPNMCFNKLLINLDFLGWSLDAFASRLYPTTMYCTVQLFRSHWVTIFLFPIRSASQPASQPSKPTNNETTEMCTRRRFQSHFVVNTSVIIFIIMKEIF